MIPVPVVALFVLGLVATRPTVSVAGLLLLLLYLVHRR